MIEIIARMTSVITNNESDENNGNGSIDFTIDDWKNHVIVTVNSEQHHWISLEDFKKAINAILNDVEEDYDDVEYEEEDFN